MDFEQKSIKNAPKCIPLKALPENGKIYLFIAAFAKISLLFFGDKNFKAIPHKKIEKIMFKDIE